MSSHKISWSDLPDELLTSIADRLEKRPDILRFRAVCKAWHRSAPFSLLKRKNVLCPFLPHKLKTTQPPLLKGGAAARAAVYGDHVSMSSLKLVASSIFLIKSTTLSDHVLAPWLVAVEELNPGKLRLLRAFSRFPVENVPQEFPKELELSRFEVEEMGKVYSLRFDYKPYHLFEENHKVLLLGDHTDTVDSCTAAVLRCNGVLAVIRLKDESVRETSFKGRNFDDIVIFKGRVYAIDMDGRAYWMDNSSSDRLKMWKVLENALDSDSVDRCRLVESCDELYLVRKYSVSRPGTILQFLRIRVFKLDEEQNSWDELKSIGGDRILFLTPDCGFFAQASSFPGWKGNCVVIHERESFGSYAGSHSYGPEDTRFRNNTDDRKLKIDVYHFKDGKLKPVQTNPGYSVVFWPPPKWLSSDTCLPKSKSSSAEGFCTPLMFGQDSASQIYRELGSMEGISSPPGYEPHSQAKTNSSALQVLENVSAKDAATDVQGKLSIAVDSTSRAEDTRANSLLN